MPQQHRLSANELGLIVDWLRGEWFRPTVAESEAGEVEPPAESTR